MEIRQIEELSPPVVDENNEMGGLLRNLAQQSNAVVG